MMKYTIAFFMIITSLSIMTMPLHAQSSNNNLTKDVFDDLVEKWKQEIEEDPSLKFQSSSEPFMKLESFQKIMSYNAQAIPLLIEEMPKVGRGFIGECYYGAVIKISKKRFEDEIIRAILNDENKVKTLFYTYIDWWENGYQDDLDKFNSLYASYLQNESNEDKQKILDQIKHLGIRVLPLAIIKIEEGNTQLIPVVDHLTDGEFNKQFKDRPEMNDRQKVLQWWEEDKDRWVVTPKEDKPE